METGTLEEKRQNYLKAVVIDPKKTQGVWELKIDVKNTQGSLAFGGRRLNTYIHPLTGTRVPLIDMDGQETLGFMIERPTMRLHPDVNQMDRRTIDWLLSHPEVGVEGVELTDVISKKKLSNPSVRIKNIDRQEMSAIENEDRIDFVIGKISDDNPKTGLSLERLRYLLAHFNLPYFDIRYIKNKTTEKKFLRQKLKNFARGIEKDGSLNADKIDKIIDEIDGYKYNYEFKEMLRHNIIKESHGMYKYDNVPLGSNDQSVINWMKTNLEIYTNMTAALYPILKTEGFNFK